MQRKACGSGRGEWSLCSCPLVKKDGFEVCVNNERSSSHVLPVGELDSVVGHRKDVKRGNVILSSAQLLLPLVFTLMFEMTKAALAEECMSIICSHVTE